MINYCIKYNNCVTYKSTSFVLQQNICFKSNTNNNKVNGILDKKKSQKHPLEQKYC